ncbi:MAG TPA: hypothetical protein V6D14_09900 [Coleofasciculaceae cyanobacterium]|jgi:hypothetical protein
METTKFELTRADLRLADIIAQGSDGQIVLLVEVKGTELKSRKEKLRVISQVKSYLQTINLDIPYFLGWLQSQSTS